MTDAMTFAVIGFGAWGKFHARSIAKANGARLAAIAAHGEDSQAEARAEFPGVRVTGDWRSVIADPGIAALAIVSPNHLHAEMTVAGLDAGKHVLVEKPMATTVADCDRIVAAAARSKGVVTVGLELRLSPQWGRIRALIADGAVGRPQHVHVSLFRHPYRPGAGGWRHDRARVGSWILEEPVHFFDLALWYLADAGRPVSVQALATGAPDRGVDMAPVLSSLLRFPNGATASINQVLSGFGHLQAVEVTGDKGAIRATWAAETARSTAPSADLKIMRVGSDTIETIVIERSGEVFELEAQAEAAVAAFRDRRPIVSAEEGRAAVAVSIAAEQSARQNGREVTVV